MVTPQVVFDAVAVERGKQNAVWGDIAERTHDIAAYLLLIRMELQEAELAWAKNDGNYLCLMELTQVLALIDRCYDQHATARPYGIANVFDLYEAGIPNLGQLSVPEWLEEIDGKLQEARAELRRQIRRPESGPISAGVNGRLSEITIFLVRCLCQHTE